MKVLDILHLCHERKVKVALDDSSGKDVDLKVTTERDGIPRDIKTLLVANKQEIVAFLQATAAKNIMIPASTALASDQTSLSPRQKGLWFLHQLMGANAIYNTQLAVQFSGDVDISILGCCLTEIVERHDSLRTRFQVKNGEPVQITDQTPVTIQLEQVADASAVYACYQAEKRYPFNMNEERLCRIRLLKNLADSNVVLIVNLHHSICDGASRGVFFSELMNRYRSCVDGQTAPLAALDIQFADFARWQHEQLQQHRWDSQLNFWQEELQELPQCLNLPSDRIRPKKMSYKGQTISATLQGADFKELEHFSKTQNVTLFNILISTFSVLLARYSGQTDIAIGTPVANRRASQLESLIGYFANILILRVRLDTDAGFATLVQENQARILRMLDNQDVPFEILVEKLNPERSLSYSPLFQVMFAMQHAAISATSIGDLTAGPLPANPNVDDCGVSRFDLTLNVVQTDSALTLELEYSTDLFERATITRFLQHYQQLLNAAITTPHTKVSQLTWLTDAEKLQLKKWNQTETPGTDLLCIHQIFEAKAATKPDSCVVLNKEHPLTFEQLNQRANQLARHLISIGVKPEVRVGLCTGRSVEMLVGLLAILKAGGAYVPLDPNYPLARLQLMLQSSSVSLIVTESAISSTEVFNAMLCANLQGTPLNYIDIDVEQSWRSQTYSVENPNIAVSPDNLAYVIYTSGSTGMPKGVAVSHKGWANLAFAQLSRFAIDASSRIMQFSSLSFDASVFEFAMLGAGSSMYLLSEKQRQSPEALCQISRKYGITHVTLPQSVLGHMEREHFNPDTTIIVAGEAISRERALHWSQGRKFFNAYGPTETTVCASAGLFTGGEIHIGTALMNHQCHVLDEELQPVPVGVIGELYIGGIGLARGYLNQADLTAERFIPDAFSSVAGKRLYRTGDLVRYLPDGNIVFVGRVDEQVKLRGFRIELDEIKAALLRHSGIQDALVSAQDDQKGELQLVAWVVRKPQQNYAEGSAGDSLLQTEVKALLRQQLPAFMLPSLLFVLKAWPLTRSGKIDRKALPAYEADAQTGDFELPASATEMRLADIWSELLQVPAVGRQQNFFHLGGHSLLVNKLAARLRETFNAELTVKLLFELTTIADQAQEVEKLKNPAVISQITTAGTEHPVALSFAQQRLWFLQQFIGANAVYNMSMAFILEGQLDHQALLASLELLVKRHEALRTYYELSEQDPVQVISSDADIIYSDNNLARAHWHREIAFERHYKFDLSKGPLSRIRLLKDAETQASLLMITMHHSISDGWSMGIFLKELSSLYAAFSQGKPSPLTPLSIQYRDYARWQREYLATGVVARQLAYWRQQLHGLPTLLNLPLDRPRPAEQTYSGDKVYLELPGKLISELRTLAQKQGATLYMSLLAALAVLLSRYSGQRDLAIGMPVANRQQKETESLIGIFVNSLVMRVNLTQEPDFNQLLRQVRATALEAYSHQELPFEQLIEKLSPQRDPSHSPLFQVMFSLQDAPESGFNLEQVNVIPVTQQNQQIILPEDSDRGLYSDEQFTKFDLTFNLHETDEGVAGCIEYNTDLFDEQTLTRLAKHYLHLLTQLVQFSESPVTQLNILQQHEVVAQIDYWQQKQVVGNVAGQPDLLQLLGKQVAEKPHQAAIVAGDLQLSYAQLEQKAHQLACYLTEQGVEPDQQVALWLDGSMECLLGALAIIKCGACYLPLLPETPLLKVRFLLEDAGAKAVLGHSSSVSMAASLAASGQYRVIEVDQFYQMNSASFSGEKPEIPLRLNRPVCLVYDTHHAGIPQGSVITAQNIVSVAENFFAQDQFPGNEALETVELVGGAGLMAAQQLVWASLCRGITVRIKPATVSAQRLLDRTRLNIASFSIMTPTSVRLQADGDALTAPGKALLSLGGVLLHTDPMPQSTCAANAKPTEIRIGAVVSQAALYVFNGQLPAPCGAVGELCIYGAGVTDGYVNAQGLSSLAFADFPLSGHKAGKMYRSGLLARALPNGQVQLLLSLIHI